MHESARLAGVPEIFDPTARTVATLVKLAAEAAARLGDALVAPRHHAALEACPEECLLMLFVCLRREQRLTPRLVLGLHSLAVARGHAVLERELQAFDVTMASFGEGSGPCRPGR